MESYFLFFIFYFLFFIFYFLLAYQYRYQGYNILVAKLLSFLSSRPLLTLPK